MSRSDPLPDPAGPDRECPLCPRLVDFRSALRRDKPDYHNAPVPAFGPVSARLLVVGLAPGMNGANRTGRPFTGDFAGELLYPTLKAFGFAAGTYAARPDDGFTLADCRISNSVRCVPPQNKPLPEEIRTCRQFLTAELAAMPRLRVIVALGRIAHDAALAAQSLRPSAYRFAHGAVHELPAGRVLADSYHSSRYNTNTGRLTPAMFESVFAEVRRRLDTGS